ncbi:DUF4145 domain-containing protein [Burkholderia sp. Ac-20349]|uniref:DUF4145 domain-containing protein n=1 Tax=Burkholderia sp. Ac-20349 TaxID=2703893 RepID=UPI00197BCB6C|nr:DUF4145 domain-containing protein [Burkholderia sp. Ac-20349]MBN3839194.1 DUF4145 domain-containing protein [Burkholderia sp. Ac-20349]
MTFTPPAFRLNAFTCPHCSAYAHAGWFILNRHNNGNYTQAWISTCSHCTKETLWWADEVSDRAPTGKMVVPAHSIIPLPHPDMPEDVARDYEEARAVSAVSPRAACALLRVAIERLCVALKADGDSINKQIGYLVKQGLNPQIQQALDVVRVVGNNAVHPGMMDPDDVADVSNSMFTLVNLIVEDRITRPKTVAVMFAALPEGARKAIEKRDGQG